MTGLAPILRPGRRADIRITHKHRRRDHPGNEESNMPTNFITLPRSELYELVWSKPVTEVARELGVSDVALAKRCRALNIPLPWRGFWAKVQAGQTPRRTPLRPFRDRGRKSLPGYVTVPDVESGHRDGLLEVRPQTVTSQGQASASSHGGVPGVSGDERSKRREPEPTISFAPPADPKPAAPPLSPEEAALRTRIDALDLTPPTDLTAAHPAVLRTAVHLKHLKQKDITWPRGTRSGPILEMTNVSEPQLDRALRVLDTVLRATETLGWPFEPPPADPATNRQQTFARSDVRPPLYGQLLVAGEPITLRIDERRRQSDHVMTEQEKADIKRGREPWMPRFDYAPSGELRLHLSEPDYSWTDKTWKDTRTRPLETQLKRILTGMLDCALARKARHAEAERRAIEERARARQQAILRAHRTANEKLIHTLETQAGAWHRAQYLRRYLRAARRTLGARTLTVDLQGQAIDFLAWADHYVNQLDPLHPDPRNPNFAHERSCQYNEDEKGLQQELRRLFGHQWEHASKLRES